VHRHRVWGCRHDYPGLVLTGHQLAVLSRIVHFRVTPPSPLHHPAVNRGCWAPSRGLLSDCPRPRAPARRPRRLPPAGPTVPPSSPPRPLRPLSGPTPSPRPLSPTARRPPTAPQPPPLVRPSPPNRLCPPARRLPSDARSTMRRHWPGPGRSSAAPRWRRRGRRGGSPGGVPTTLRGKCAFQQVDDAVEWPAYVNFRNSRRFHAPHVERLM
jgi:hypothetical protein